MADVIRDVMTGDPVALPEETTVREAAQRMKDSDIGNVIVLTDGQVCGIVTDRDIVIRAVAEGRNPDEVRLADICSKDLVSVSPDDPVDRAVQLMRERSIRRLPVVENDQPIGVVSIGDLAVDRDSDSALADISAAPPDR